MRNLYGGGRRKIQGCGCVVAEPIMGSERSRACYVDVSHDGFDRVTQVLKDRAPVDA